MKRRPRPLVVTTALPSLAALVSAGLVEGCRPDERVRTANPPPPPPRAADAGVVRLPPTPIDPSNLPIAPAGAIAPVRPTPAPRMELQGAPAPPAAIPAAPAASAVAAQANAEAQADAVWGAARPMIVHNHPPGTPCTPIARAELERAVRSAPR